MYIILHFLLTPIKACLSLILLMSDCVYSISSPIRHTCSVHGLSKILMRIYHIVIQTHISPWSKITEVHQNKKSSIICSSQDFSTKLTR